MTAPLRSHGQLVEVVKRGCHDKTRFSDEWAARAVGKEVQADRKVRMFIYLCRICRGWHLTKNIQQNRTHSVDWVFTSPGKDERPK